MMRNGLGGVGRGVVVVAEGEGCKYEGEGEGEGRQWGRWCFHDEKHKTP